MNELGEMKRVQELRVDEFSLQKLREYYETKQEVTSQLQEIQDQMNFMNDSGECQEVESNHSGRLSYVPSVTPGMQSSRSTLSCDKRLPLDTWNTSGLQEDVFGNRFSTVGLPRNHQGIHNDVFSHMKYEERDSSTSNWRPISQEMTNKVETQCRCRHQQEGHRL